MARLSNRLIKILPYIILSICIPVLGIAVTGIPPHIQNSLIRYATQAEREDSAWSITFRPAAGHSQIIDVEGADDFTINWGDGNISNVTGSATLTHPYAIDTDVNILMYGTVEGLTLHGYRNWNWGPKTFNNPISGIRGLKRLKFSHALIAPLRDMREDLFKWLDKDSFNVYNLYGEGSVLVTNFPNVNHLIGLENLDWAFHGILSSYVNLPNLDNLTNLTSLEMAWYGIGKYYYDEPRIVFPAVNHLVNVTNLTYTWYNTGNKEYPEISNLTKVTSLYGTWMMCQSGTSFPAVNNLTNVTTLERAWYGCPVGPSFPAVNNLTNVTTLRGAWGGCQTPTVFPAVNNLTNVTTLRGAWGWCNSMLNAPEITPSVNLTNTTEAFAYCSAITNNLPELWNTSLFPNITSHAQTFYECTNAANWGDVPEGWK